MPSTTRARHAAAVAWLLFAHVVSPFFFATARAQSTLEEQDEIVRRRDARRYGVRVQPQAPLTPEARSVQAPALLDRALRGPVDETIYIVGPGDLFAITVWAQPTLTLQAAVSPEGDLVLPGVATVHVAGSTLVDAKAAVRREIGRQYRNVALSISLLELRRIEVSVVGDVQNAGTYVGTAMDAASRMVDLAGGTGDDADRRNIVIRRRSGQEQRVDLLRYERTGELAANPPILDGDVIVVPWTTSTVVIDGAVAMPGTYPFVEGDTIGSLVDLGGGLRSEAKRDSVELRRFVDDARTEERIVSISDDPAAAQIALLPGDQVYVRSSTPDWRPVEMVLVEGEVRHPGPYGINEGVDRVLDVLRRAGGFTDEASLEEAQLFRSDGADSIDAEYERLQQVPVQEMSREEYSYFKTRGRQLRGLVLLDFKKLEAGDEDENRLLVGGDRLVIPRKDSTIAVSGRVDDPGLVDYVPGKRPSYYVQQAGGYSSDADRDDARVLRGVNGEWQRLSDVDAVLPGDEIWVPEKQERSWWQLARESVAFVASVATIYLVIDQATD